MDDTIKALRATIPSLKSSLKVATAKLNTLKSAPTTSELGLLVENIRAENKLKMEKLTGLKEGSVKQISKEHMETIEKEWRYWTAKKKARKNAFYALEGQFADAMPKEELWEKAGIESED
jgi:26S proteasome regulatory subunit (ATPase 3-interacting protein)